MNIRPKFFFSSYHCWYASKRKGELPVCARPAHDFPPHGASKSLLMPVTIFLLLFGNSSLKLIKNYLRASFESGLNN